MVTMKHHHARGPEETVFDLPLLVPTRPASRRSSTMPGQNVKPGVGGRLKPVGRCRNPDYAIAYRLDQRAARSPSPPEPLRLTPSMNKLPWDVAKNQFGSQATDFIGVIGVLIISPNPVPPVRHFTQDLLGKFSQVPKRRARSRRGTNRAGPDCGDAARPRNRRTRFCSYA